MQLIPWKLARDRITSAHRIAFDLEGDFNLHRYGRKICLFQIALDDGSTFLLDPLHDELGAPSQWPGWKDLLEDPSVTKVIWAAQNDIRALKFCHGMQLRGLWDLFDAACMVVTPRPSLPGLVGEFLGHDIEKTEALQTSDWSLRPLSGAQLAYAAQDVQHLLSLADRLDPMLDLKKKREDFKKRMTAAEAYVFVEHAEPWRKIKGSGSLLPEHFGRLEQAWKKREALAKDLDLAPWKILPTSELLNWAREGRFSNQVLVDPRWSDG